MTNIRLLRADWYERDIEMRLPFQFGNTEVWGAPEAYARVSVEIDGVVHTGRAAQLMVPRWFNKNPALSNEQTVDELRKVVRKTVDLIPGREGTAFTISRELRQDVAAAMPDIPALASGFGPALIEMAVIDAVCVAHEAPFWRAARDDLFGLIDERVD